VQLRKKKGDFCRLGAIQDDVFYAKIEEVYLDVIGKER
jgi:hypothetical protein